MNGGRNWPTADCLGQTPEKNKISKNKRLKKVVVPFFVSSACEYEVQIL